MMLQRMKRMMMEDLDFLLFHEAIDELTDFERRRLSFYFRHGFSKYIEEYRSNLGVIL